MAAGLVTAVVVCLCLSTPREIEKQCNVIQEYLHAPCLLCYRQVTVDEWLERWTSYGLNPGWDAFIIFWTRYVTLIAPLSNKVHTRALVSCRGNLRGNRPCSTPELFKAS